MSYNGDKELYCDKERKKTKHTRCPHCNGQGDKQLTTCGWHCQAGYWCVNGIEDKWHK